MIDFINTPDPELVSIALLAGILGLFCLFMALHHIRRQQLIRAGIQSLFATGLLSTGLILLSLSINLYTYQRLITEQPVADIHFKQVGLQQYEARFIQSSNQTEQRYTLYGDEWQIDARVLKWKTPAILLGLDARYRLERLSGRYRNINQEREMPRAVYNLAPDVGLDIWALIGKLQRYAGWVDAYYGSASYLPMANDAHYEILLNQSGVLARPINKEAEQALYDW